MITPTPAAMPCRPYATPSRSWLCSEPRA